MKRKVKSMTNNKINLATIIVLIFSAGIISSATTSFGSVQSISAIPIGTINVGICPQGIAYDSSKGELFVANGCLNPSTVTVISDSNNTVVATIPVGGNPVGIAYDSSKGELFVANEGSNTISVISDSTNTVVSTIPVGNGPRGIVYDSAKNEIFVANQDSGSVSVISDSTNTVVSTIEFLGAPYDLTYDSAKGEIFVTNLNGGIYVISDNTNSVTDVISGVGLTPVGISYDPSKGEVFVTAVNGHDISIISDSTNSVVATIQGLGNSDYLGITYDSNGKLFAANFGNNTVSVISDSTNTVISNVQVGIFPEFLAYDSGKSEVIVTNLDSRTASIIPDPTDPITETNNLVIMIQNMNLQGGITDSLDAKLQSVRDSLNSNHNIQAANQLNAFINEVNAQAGKKITQVQANQLVSQAKAIINLQTSTKAANMLVTVDSNSSTGEHPSIAIGNDGLPIISYLGYGASPGLKVAHCGDVECSKNNTITRLDSNAEANSIAIGKDGLPVIVYRNGTSGDLKVLKCGNLACSAANTITIVDPNVVSDSASISIGNDGLPIISYDSFMIDATTKAPLKVLKCGNTSCSAGNIVTYLDQNSGSNSITVGADGLPVIAYTGPNFYTLNVLKCGNVSCSSENSIAVAYTLPNRSQGQQNPSIKIGSDNLPVISSIGPKVIHCNDIFCHKNVLSWIDANGTDSSLAIGMDGLPIISYFDTFYGHLKVAHCGDLSCKTNNALQIVDFSSSDVGHDTSIAIGSDGLPIISYWDRTNGYLKVAHCGSVSC